MECGTGSSEKDILLKGQGIPHDLMTNLQNSVRLALLAATVDPNSTVAISDKLYGVVSVITRKKPV